MVSAESLRAAIERADAEQAAAETQPLSDQPLADRYPEERMPIAGALPPMLIDAGHGEEAALLDGLRQARDRYDRFCDVRQELLRGYCYNTARAYCGDLDDIYLWVEERGKDVLALSLDPPLKYSRAVETDSESL